MTKRICDVDECDNWAIARGWCSGHYARNRRHGDPLRGGPQRTNRRRVHTWGAAPLEWLREAFERADHTDACITGWPFTTDGHGYPQIWHDGRQRQAHHLILVWMGQGDRSDGRECRHLCGNGHLGCLSKRHLMWGTHRRTWRTE